MASPQQEGGYGNGQFGGVPGQWSPAVHDHIDGHGDVTAQFGEGPNKGHALIADGHARDRESFVGQSGARRHDHYDGQGGGADHRGRYNGPGH